MENITKLVSDLVSLASAKKDRPEVDKGNTEEVANDAEKTEKTKAQATEVKDVKTDVGQKTDPYVEVEELTRKHTRTVTELKAKIAELEQELEKKSKSPKKEPEDPLEDARKELSKAQDNLLQAHEDLAEAKLLRNDTALAKARRDYKKALRELREAENIVAREQDKIERQKARNMTEKIKQFSAGLEKAMDRFPELLDEKGRLDGTSPIIKRAMELMREGEQDSHFLFDPEDGTPVKINPRYDNVDGQYNAVRDAIDEIGESSDEEIKRIRYEKNVLNKRLIKERSKHMDPSSNAFVPGVGSSVSALRKKLDDAEKTGDIAQFQRIRMHIEKLENNRKDS